MEKLDPVAMSKKLRDQALSVTAQDLNLEPIEARPHVWGALMELGYPGAVATLVAFADGSTSLYISTGGGMIGAGQDKEVREEGDRFLAVAEQHIADFEPAENETPPPQRGQVRFYVRTFQSTLTAQVEETLLMEGQHRLSPVFVAGHAVITQMRLMSERLNQGE
jgi:hypothetical protein